MNRSRIQTSLLIVIATCVWAPTLSAVDIVTRRSDNAKIRGSIERSDQTQIVVKRTNGEEEVIPVSNIKRVEFDGEPQTLNQARTNEASGAHETALEKLREIRTSYNGSNAALKADIDFLIARVLGSMALVDATKADEAIKALGDFRSSNKDNFRYLEATLLQASLHAKKQETDAGKTLLAELQQCAVKGFQLQAGVELGRLLLNAGDAAGAQAAFEDVVSKSQGDESAAGAMFDGMLGRAMCLKQQNQLDPCIQALDDVISQAPETETRILAEAWLRKGDCLRLQSEAKAALMAYLHVDVLYPGESLQHAEALARLAELWKPTGHEDRAIEAAAKLTERYPNSEWAKQGTGG
ncbi:MAG: tetratricopeptide repeat protein [Planctomycetaceae bacterium]